MAIKIDKKVKAWAIKKDIADSDSVAVDNVVGGVSIGLHEDIKRDSELEGKTYKIKIPTSEHAVYVTVNRIMVDGVYHPYECFINCKDSSHAMWITAITRLISATMRKGGNVRFIADELMQVFDPASGGHWTKKGDNGEKPRFMPSLVAEIGFCLLKHFDYIDDLNKIEDIRNDIDERVRTYNNSLNSESNVAGDTIIEKPTVDIDDEISYPKNTEICPSCKQKSAMRLDGCLTCLDGACAYSKCG